MLGNGNLVNGTCSAFEIIPTMCSGAVIRVTVYYYLPAVLPGFGHVAWVRSVCDVSAHPAVSVRGK